jgi:hypothetical protein
MNEADIKLYGEFTQLKRNGLQTWIAVGGVSKRLPKNGESGSRLTYSSGRSTTLTPQQSLHSATWFRRQIIGVPLFSP